MKQSIVVLLTLCLSLAILVIAADSSVKSEQIAKISAVSFSEHAPHALPVSPQAVEEWTVPPSSSMDAKWWILHTRQLLNDGLWRIRYTTLDNAPAGRDVDWSSLLIWTLALLAQLMSFFNGQPAINNVPEAAMMSGPILLAISVLGLAWLVFRRFGIVAAIFFATVILTNPTIYRTFHFGEADHHGIVLIFAVACVFSLLAGGVGTTLKRKSTPVSTADFIPAKSAARWFAVSGLFGAAALWISAATAVPILVGTALGAFLAGWPEKEKNSAPSPDLWRIWGISGCLGSVFFYALEYFPHHMGWRMEVNHPLYALAWLGGGELLSTAIRLRQGNTQTSQPIPWWRIGGCILLVSLPPAVIFLFSGRIFWVSDRFLLALHQEYILEFQNMLTFVRSSEAPFTWPVHYGWPIFGFLGSLILWRRRELSPWARRGLVMLLPPTLVMQGLAFYQVRWAYASMGIWSLVVLVLFVGSRKPGTHLTPAWVHWTSLVTAWFALMLSLTPQLIAQMKDLSTCLTPTIKQDVGNSLILRDIAHRLIQSSPSALPTVLTGPNSSTELAYYGGIQTLGTLYWENMPGLKRAAAIFASKDEQEALSRLQAAGVTHIVIPSWDNFTEAYARLYSKYEEQGDGSAPFFQSIMDGKSCPVWLRPFAYPIPTNAGLDAKSVRIFAVIPQQSLFESYYYRGVYHWEARELEAAREMFEKARQLRPWDPRANDYLSKMANERPTPATP